MRFLSGRLALRLGLLAAAAASLAVSYLLGESRETRHLRFEILFFLVAVPWPVQFERCIIQGRWSQAVTGLVERLRS